MIMDSRALFCEATALNTGGAASYLVGDVYDLGAVTNYPGNSEDTYLVIQVTTSVTSGGAGTYGFALCSDAQAAISVDGTQTTHFATAQIAKATLVAGYRICSVQLPKGAYERYLGIVQTTAVAAATAGKITAFLTKNPSDWVALADATN